MTDTAKMLAHSCLCPHPADATSNSCFVCGRLHQFTMSRCAYLTVPLPVIVKYPRWFIIVSFILEGLPKAAVVTHERVWAASFIQAVCGVTSEDIFYINLPLYHSAGFLIGMAGAIERGSKPLLFCLCTPGLDPWEVDVRNLKCTIG